MAWCQSSYILEKVTVIETDSFDIVGFISTCLSREDQGNTKDAFLRGFWK